MRRPPVASVAASIAVDAKTAGLTASERTSPAALSLDPLLLLAKEGSEPAFAELVARFERMVYGHVFRLTRDAEQTRDLTQDVFLQLWRVLPAMTTSASLASWLKKVSVNAVISHWRQQESQKRRLEALAEAFPPRQEPSPAAVLIEEEDHDQVRAALELIPAELRSILTLRVYEELSYEELAEMMGLEVGTVRSRLFRARQMMKDILERWRQHEQPQSRRTCAVAL